MEPITTSQAVSISVKFLSYIISENLYKSIIRSEITAAYDILDNIEKEGDKKLGLTRALTHLESAYYKMHKKYSGKIYNNIGQLELMNQICYHIAYIHKSLGAQQDLINNWIIEKTNYKGGYWIHTYDYKELLEDSYSIFETECLEKKEKYERWRDSLSNDISRSYWG